MEFQEFEPQELKSSKKRPLPDADACTADASLLPEGEGVDATHVVFDRSRQTLILRDMESIQGVFEALTSPRVRDLQTVTLANIKKCPLKYFLTPLFHNDMNLAKAQRLVLTHCPILASSSTSTSAWGLSFTRLEIAHCPAIHAGALLDFLQVMPHLQELSLASCTILWTAASSASSGEAPQETKKSRQQLIASVQRCVGTTLLPKLEVVHVARVRGVTRFLAVLLATAGPSLRQVSVSDLLGLDASDAASPPGADSTQEFNAMLEAFAQQPCAQSVEMVRLECTPLGGAGLRAVAKCPRVRVLAVSGCPQLRDSDLASVVGLPLLRELFVDGCHQVRRPKQSPSSSSSLFSPPSQHFMNSVDASRSQTTVCFRCCMRAQTCTRSASRAPPSTAIFSTPLACSWCRRCGQWALRAPPWATRVWYGWQLHARAWSTSAWPTARMSPTSA
jgi:hypothetical protein